MADCDGYIVFQFGVGEVKVKWINKVQCGYFVKVNVVLKCKLVEFCVNDDVMIEVGVELMVDYFVFGQKVDVVGIFIGKGFVGVMKCYNFGGLWVLYGVFILYCLYGFMGQCQDLGKVFKGKKMVGYMGVVCVIMQNIEVVCVDVDCGFVWFKGVVLGFVGGWVELCDVVKGVKVDDLLLLGVFCMFDEFNVLVQEEVLVEVDVVLEVLVVEVKVDGEEGIEV